MATSKRHSCAYTLPTGGSARAFFTIHTDALRAPLTTFGALGDIYINTTNPPSVFVRYATQWRGPLARTARSGINHPKYPELVLSDGNATKTTWVRKQAAGRAGVKRKVEDGNQGRPMKKVRGEEEEEEEGRDASILRLNGSTETISTTHSPPLPPPPPAPVQAEPVSLSETAPRRTPPDTKRSSPSPPASSPRFPDAQTPISTEEEMIPVPTTLAVTAEPDALVAHGETTTAPVTVDPPRLPTAQPRISTPEATIPVLAQPPANESVAADTNMETTQTTAPVTLGWIRCSTPPAMPNVPLPSVPPLLLNISNITVGISSNPTLRGPRQPVRDFASASGVVRNFWASSAGGRENCDGWVVPQPASVPPPPNPYYRPSRPGMRSEGIANSNSAAPQELRSSTVSTARAEPGPPPHSFDEPPISGPPHQAPQHASAANANANVPVPSGSHYRPRPSITPALSSKSALIEQNSELRARVEVLEAENAGLRKENEVLRRVSSAELVTLGLEGMSTNLKSS
ncbi:hypothetical protein FB45DRAFT_932309 [Roridomyces roridus]|uniref:Uncharacterized protein n=1 Tax=Roridomyces roridus TaxID=1738132 RepID=A0AAD7BEJ0_9AGAR|nr:hypothetical protein FB45DRAFT_932309 [Roridomyces roridus]